MGGGESSPVTECDVLQPVLSSLFCLPCVYEKTISTWP